MASAEWIHGQGSSHRRQSGRHLQYVLQQSSSPAAVTPSEASTTEPIRYTERFDDPNLPAIVGRPRRSPTVVLRYSPVRAIEGRDRASLTFVRGYREQSVEINVKSVDRLPLP